MSRRTAPSRVSLRVRGVERPAEALEISGQRAALRFAGPLGAPMLPDDSVHVTLSWTGGGCTFLPARVRSVADSASLGGHVAHVEVEGVEGDWQPFLEYLGAA